MIDFSFSFTDFEFFLLVFCRMISFVGVAPFFGTQGVPNEVKIAISVFLSAFMYSAIGPHEAVVYDSVLEYSFIAGKEIITGLILGLGVNICTYIITFAGRFIDMEMGLAMASEYNPLTRETSSVTGILYQYLVLLILLASNLHQYLIKAFLETYSLIPVNGAIFHGDKLVLAFVKFMSDFISIGFQIALPIFCVLLIANCILGIMAKVAPQLNMFAVGIQIKLLLGFGVLFLTVGMLPYISEFIFKEMKTMMVTFVEAMMA